jgi:PAS domain S-box-containing protein
LEIRSDSVPTFDWRALQRWGISESRLPPDSVIRFRELSVWQQYKWLIVLVLSVCMLEAGLIDILLRERRRRRHTQQQLEERLRFERLVAELSNTFINLPPNKVEDRIIDALGRVAQALRFDIAALSVFTGRGAEGRVGYMWRAERVPEIPLDLTDKDFPWVAQELLAGRDVCLRDLEMLPLAARADRATYEKYHVRSTHNVPMIAGGKVIGTLGLCTAWEERDMPPELLQGQRLLGEIFANALARKAAEEARRESEENLRNLVETTAAVPWQCDPENWNFTYVGPQAVRLLGYPLKQWYKKDFWVSHLHPDDADFAINTCLASSRTAQDFDFEYRMIAASGESVWVHDTVHCERQDGKLVQLRGFLLNITGHKRTEEALETERKFLRQVIDIDPNFIFAKDRNGRFTLANQAVADAYGTTVERLIGKTDADFNSNRVQLEFFHRMDLQVLDTLQELFIPEEQITDAQGRVRWLQTVKRPILGTDGLANHVLGASTDITRRKETEIELQEQRAELAHVARVSVMGELAASLAHELNQPLTAILSNAQAALRFLSSKRPDLEEVREILQDIVKDNSRAGEVIRRMRALVKKEELEVSNLDLPSLVRDVVMLVHSDAILQSVRISLDLHDDLPAVRGDRVQLQQVLLNILLNAFDAMKECPASTREVKLQAQSDGAGLIQVAVSDCGPGLSADKLDKIFQPFYTTKGDGLGMGLSICRSIIQAHGGRLWAENNASCGVTFYFTLPVADEG